MCYKTSKKLVNYDYNDGFMVVKQTLAYHTSRTYDLCGTPARRPIMNQKPIIDGKCGDKFEVPANFQGNWNNAKGIPVKQHLPEATIVTRPDFRKVPKDAPVFNRK
uniref:DUF1996 domain-containing protein n=1 Tax=Panagrellus redivivus TaxID=6233 RepID=A0A7E4VL64_PANRE